MPCRVYAFAAYRKLGFYSNRKLLICRSNNRITSRRCQLAVEQATSLGEKGMFQLTEAVWRGLVVWRLMFYIAFTSGCTEKNAL